MKIIALIAAGLMAVAASAPASAQMQERHNTRVVTRTVVHTERDRHYNNGRHNGWRKHTRRVCTNKYRNHRRIRVCRTVRY